MIKMGYLKKFAVIALFFLGLIAMVSFFLFTEIDNNVNFTNKERIGLEVVGPILSIIQDIQKHRGQASAYLNGDEQFSEIMRENENKIEKEMSLIDEIRAKREKELLLKYQWEAIKGKWFFLMETNLSITSEESFYKHTDLLKDIFLLNKHLGNVSNLILDPRAETYHLINTVINLIPELTEHLGQIRAFGLSIPQDQILTREEKRFINNLISSVNITLSQIETEQEFILAGINEEQGRKLKVFLSANKNDIAELLNYLDFNLIDQGKMVSYYEEYYNQITKRIDSLFLLSDSLLPLTDQLLKDRVKNMEAKKDFVLGAIVFTVMAIMYLLVGFYFSVKKTIGELEEISRRIRQGSLEEKIKLSTKDELGRIGDLFADIGATLVNVNKTLRDDITKIKETEEKLRTRTEEMEKINSFMTDRELKMAELKNEIKELRARVEKKD